MRHKFGVLEYVSRRQYAVYTVLFSTLVLGSAGLQDGPVSQLFSSPWTTLGMAMDDTMDNLPWFAGGKLRALNSGLSLAGAALFFSAFFVLTAGRLRDVGQSPWWALGLAISGITIPAMILFSLLPSNRPRLNRRTVSEGSVGVTPEFGSERS